MRGRFWCWRWVTIFCCSVVGDSSGCSGGVFVVVVAGGAVVVVVVADDTSIGSCPTLSNRIKVDQFDVANIVLGQTVIFTFECVDRVCVRGCVKGCVGGSVRGCIRE